MSLDIEQRLRVFLASAPARIRQIQVLEIWHSAISQRYFLWREPYDGMVHTAEHGWVAVRPLNMQIVLSGTEANLDQQFDISIDTVDENDEFRTELDRVPIDTQERISVVYREYLSDDLEEPLAIAFLQTETIAYKKGAATITAVAPRLNAMRTGELYEPRVVPMLRAFY